MQIASPMLCYRAKTELDIQFPCLATPKLDGIRCLKVNGIPLSRSWKPIRNEHIVQHISLLPDGVDGELIAIGGTFQDTTSAVMSYGGQPDFGFVVFDYVNTEASNASGALAPYHERASNLASLPVFPWLYKLHPTLCETADSLLAFEAECIAAGYEGIIARSINGPYKFGRSTRREGYIFKLKRYIDSDAVIIGFEEQEQNLNPIIRNVFGKARRPGGRSGPGGRAPKGTLGSLLCRDPINNWDVSIGSGMDDSLRQAIWDDQQSYIGSIVTYRYQGVGVKDKPRFPSFVRFRDAADFGVQHDEGRAVGTVAVAESSDIVPQ